MKIKKIISLIESLSPNEMKLLEKLLERKISWEDKNEGDGWKWGKNLDFRFINSEIIISPYDELTIEAYNSLNDLDEEEWNEYVNDLAKYGISIKYNSYEDEFKIYPSIR